MLNNPRTPNLKESFPAVNWLKFAGTSIVVLDLEIVFCFDGDNSVFYSFSTSFSAYSVADANRDGVTILVSITASSSFAEFSKD